MLLFQARGSLKIVLKENAKSSKAQASKRYREKKKSAEWLDKERLRVKQYRNSMTDEQQKASNEKAKERMRKMRARKKEAAGGKTKTVTRSEEEKKISLRAYKTEKQRQYRAEYSAQKKRAIRAKDCAYRAEKTKREKEELAKKAAKKAASRKKSSQPKSTEQIANHVEKLIESAIPTTSSLLKSRFIYKKKVRRALDESLSAVGTRAKDMVLKVLRTTPVTIKQQLPWLSSCDVHH